MAAMRSLVVMLKALPLRAPASRAFATATKPKCDLSRKIAAAKKCSCPIERAQTIARLLRQREKISREKYWKIMEREVLSYDLRLVLLGGAGGMGAIAYYK